MPDIEFEIAGRSFTVSCAEGEEALLTSAAALLDHEAKAATGEGRMTAERTLLLAGLVLADKALSADEELRSMDRRLASQAREIEALRARAAPEPRLVEREVVPAAALARAEALAKRAEALAGD